MTEEAAMTESEILQAIAKLQLMKTKCATVDGKTKKKIKAKTKTKKKASSTGEAVNMAPMAPVTFETASAPDTAADESTKSPKVHKHGIFSQLTGQNRTMELQASDYFNSLSAPPPSPTASADYVLGMSPQPMFNSMCTTAVNQSAEATTAAAATADMAGVASSTALAAGSIFSADILDACPPSPGIFCFGALCVLVRA